MYNELKKNYLKSNKVAYIESKMNEKFILCCAIKYYIT